MPWDLLANELEGAILDSQFHQVISFVNRNPSVWFPIASHGHPIEFIGDLRELNVEFCFRKRFY